MSFKVKCKHCNKEFDSGRVWSACYCQECLEDEIPDELASWAAEVVIDNALDGGDPELIADLCISKFTVRFWKTFSRIVGREFCKFIEENRAKKDDAETT